MRACQGGSSHQPWLSAPQEDPAPSQVSAQGLRPQCPRVPSTSQPTKWCQPLEGALHQPESQPRGSGPSAPGSPGLPPRWCPPNQPRAQGPDRPVGFSPMPGGQCPGRRAGDPRDLGVGPRRCRRVPELPCPPARRPRSDPGLIGLSQAPADLCPHPPRAPALADMGSPWPTQVDLCRILADLGLTKAGPWLTLHRVCMCGAFPEQRARAHLPDRTPEAGQGHTASEQWGRWTQTPGQVLSPKGHDQA